MVFGQLLTSSNYDDTEKKVTGGRNGFGAKLTNVFSKRFTITCCDPKNKKLYEQVFEKNLGETKEPKITEIEKEAIPFTKITFQPDFKKFGIKELTPDFVKLLQRRVLDVAGITSSKVSVHLNKAKINEVKDFETYVKLFLDDDEATLFKEKNNRWEVIICPSSGTFN